MIAKGLAESGHVVVAPLAGVVGSMYADAEVEADDEEAEVVAQADTRAESYLPTQVLEAELAALLTLAFA